jgi:hypothetical protein
LLVQNINTNGNKKYTKKELHAFSISRLHSILSFYRPPMPPENTNSNSIIKINSSKKMVWMKGRIKSTAYRPPMPPENTNSYSIIKINSSKKPINKNNGNIDLRNKKQLIEEILELQKKD